MPDTATESVTCRLGQSHKLTEPCSIVIFGASGDLTARKLIPALYHLYKENQMPPEFRIIGFARREKTDESFRRNCARRWNNSPAPNRWTNRFGSDSQRMFSIAQGDLTDPTAYKKLEQAIDGIRQRPLAAQSVVLPGHDAQPVRAGGRAIHTARPAPC